MRTCESRMGGERNLRLFPNLGNQGKPALQGPRRLLSAGLAQKEGRGDGGWGSHSPTGSGPEGSSPNEVRIGSLVSLLLISRANRARQSGPARAPPTSSVSLS